MDNLMRTAVVAVCMVLVRGDLLPTCQPEDFHYEYTECDSAGGRWRVSVPRPNICVGGAPNPPIRGKGCEFTCEAGQYLNIQGDQECHPCPAGSYSLGGGLRFEVWDDLPEGFTNKVEGFSGLAFSHNSHSHHRERNCTELGWVPKDTYIASLPGDCSSSLVYSVTLVRPGRVTFSYQYTDDDSIFHFQIQNDQCQSIGSKDAQRWPAMTDEGQWKTISAELKSGINLLIWKTMGVNSAARSAIKKPTLIREIEITGVAYTSQCSPCRAGTFSGQGAIVCEECPINTFSSRGSDQCMQCNTETEYAEPGSDTCSQRPPCTSNDYFTYNTPCDTNNQTQIMYKWTEPMICLPNNPQSAQLPASGEKVACPPCNPGMEYKNGSCHFCPPNMFSDGSGPCTTCPASTAPEPGLVYQWWSSLPPSANISTSCLSMDDRGCSTKAGWQTGVDNIYSGRGHADDAYLVLSLKLGGFKGHEQIIKGKPSPVAKVSFIFELECDGECALFFMVQSSSRGTSVIETWTGNQERQQYIYEFTKTEPVMLSWAFQKQGWDEEEEDMEKKNLAHTYEHTNDMAKIYVINVTNTLVGGAPHCKRCPKGASIDGCIPCPEGHYIDSNTTQCIECPAKTVVHSNNPWGEEACMECGEGLVAENHAQCTTDCRYTSPEGKEFDFTQLSKFQVISGARLFTASGTQYFHSFNISLCGGSGDFGMVMCRDNITWEVGVNSTDDEQEEDISVKSIICRSTLIPPRPGEEEGVYAAQPVSLGDTLVNITSNGDSLNMKERMRDEGFSLEDSDMDVHFTYLSEVPTSACRNGRTTIITLRCDITQPGNGTVEMPPHCPDGTCDGCDFHFLWRSKAACPQCNEQDYEEVIGECIHGEQTIHYIPPKHCVLTSGEKPTTKKRTCAILPFWLQISIYVTIGTGLIMIGLLCYCWKKNQKLEYKYMKLVGTSGGRDGELPAAETCALDEGEDDEQFDAVKFQESKGKRFFNKLKSMTSKGEDDNPFETIRLSEKDPLT